MPDPLTRLVTVVLEVSDLPRSLVLYRDGFGLHLHLDEQGHHEATADDDPDRWISGAHAATSWIDGAFLHFALYATKNGSTTRGAQVAFRVPDLDAAHVAALAAGAELVHEPRPQPWGSSARYRDFDGNVIELTQQA